jgi:hypothetical protein
MPAAASSPTKRVLDFTNVKENSGINPKHRPAGDYRMKISKVTEEPKKNAPNEFQWIFVFTPTDMQSAAYPYYCQLDEKTLWKIRNLLIACGIQVPKKRVNVDPNRLVGKEIGVTLDDDEYEGKMKSVVTAVFPASDLDDEDAPADTGDEDVADDDVADDAGDVSEDDMEELDVEDL